jgi:ribonucleoside-diphosphate reductase alpha chain
LRRIRVGKNEDIYHYLYVNHNELVEDEFFKPHLQAVITIPQKSPEGAILRTEPAIDLLERVKHLFQTWILPGHNNGSNTHNISATISIRKNEWKEVGEWMWENKNFYNGLSVIPHDENEHTYVQSPFEECDEETFNKLFSKLQGLDLSKVVEYNDNTDQKGEVACSGVGGCEIK